MKIQQVEDLKREIKGRIDFVDVAPMSAELKGAAITKEKSRRDGYKQALNDVLKVCATFSN